VKVTEFIAGETVATYEVGVDVLRGCTFLFVDDGSGVIRSFDVERDEWDAMIRQHDQARAMQEQDDRIHDKEFEAALRAQEHQKQEKA
jgi:hypothetical protein